MRDKWMSIYEEDYRKVIAGKFDHSPEHVNEFTKIKPTISPSTGVAHKTLEELFTKITVYP